METIEIKASSVEKAVEEGLEQLGLSSRDEAEIEIVQEGSLFSRAVVRMGRKETPADVVMDFLDGLFERMGLDCRADCTADEEELSVNISGPDSGVVIGYRGEVLDAIQYFALILVNGKGHNFIRVSINAENYRERRQQTLGALASRLAYKAYRTGRKIELEPMNPFERRIIHTALADSRFATTESEGEDLNRHVVIIPKEGGVRDGFRSGGFNRDRRYGRDRGDRESRAPYGGSGEDEPPAPREERQVELNVRKNGLPKFKSYGYPRKRFK